MDDTIIVIISLMLSNHYMSSCVSVATHYIRLHDNVVIFNAFNSLMNFMIIVDSYKFG